MMDEERFTDTVNILLRAAQTAGKRLVSVHVERTMLGKERYRVRSSASNMTVGVNENLPIAEMAERMRRAL